MRNKFVIAALVALSSGRAFAEDKAKSLELYGKGKSAYAEGRFADALAQFELAYREFPAPAFLQNIAQAHRRLGHCPEALAYFERFLAADPASSRSAIEEQVRSLRLQCGTTTKPEPASKPTPVAKPKAVPAPKIATKSIPPATASIPEKPAPVSAGTPSPTAPPAPSSIAPSITSSEPAPTVARPNTTVATARDNAGELALSARPAPVSRWSAGIAAGLAVMDAGPVAMPPLAQLRVGGGYSMGWPYRARVGVALDVTPLRYEAGMGESTAWLAGGQVVLDAAYPVTSRLEVIGALGVGARIVTGLGAGNPFVAGGEAATVTLPTARVELGAAWRATTKLRIRVPISYEVSPQRGALAGDIGAVHGLSIAAGVDLSL